MRGRPDSGAHRSGQRALFASTEYEGSGGIHGRRIWRSNALRVPAEEGLGNPGQPGVTKCFVGFETNYAF